MHAQVKRFDHQNDMRYRLIVLLTLLCLTTSAAAQVSVSININVPVYPELVVVPGYPVYYAPQLRMNYFFYDGMYWVYDGENWYSSFWYNGPWRLIVPVAVPVFILRIPVRYYQVPPPYFRAWKPDAPPRWGERWGREWEQRRSGWDRWDRRSAPAPAPLPAYQRNYSGDRYPRSEQQQRALLQQNYRHQPRDPVVREYYHQLRTQAPPAPAKPQQKTPRQHERSAPPSPSPSQRSQEVPRSRSPRPEQEGVERSVPAPVLAPSPHARPPGEHYEPQLPKSEGRAHGPQSNAAPPKAKGPPQKGKAEGEAKGQEHNK